MNEDLVELLCRVEKVLDRDSSIRVRSLLLDNDAILVDKSPSRQEASALMEDLRMRSTIASYTGKEIFGLTKLIGTLNEVSGSAVVLGYGIMAPKVAGNIYVCGESGDVLGVAIVDR